MWCEWLGCGVGGCGVVGVVAVGGLVIFFDGGWCCG